MKAACLGGYPQMSAAVAPIVLTVFSQGLREKNERRSDATSLTFDCVEIHNCL